MKIFAPATSANLGPGFDCLGLAIKLYNEVEIKPASFTSVSINGYGSDRAALKKNNAFIGIFDEILGELGAAGGRYRFEFVNNIPFSRGLGSSSSVIVGAIASAYEIAGFKISREAILNKALKYETHPDNISPVVWGGFTANIVAGGEVFTKKARLSEDLRAVVVIPDSAISTKQSRGKLPKNYTMSETVNNVSHASFLTACFLMGDYDSLRLACVDKMHEERRMSALPELFEVRKIAYENGALMSSLSGSGSTFFNLVYKDVASRLKAALQVAFPKFRVEIFELDNDGFFITQSKK